MRLIKVLVAAMEDRLPDMLCAGLGKEPLMRVVGRCSTAGEAIGLAGMLNPDVIVLDTRLGNMEPQQVITRIKEISGAAVVALGPAMGNALQTVNDGAVDFIPLPVRGSESDSRLFTADAISRLKVAALGRFAVQNPAGDGQPAVRLIASVGAQGGLVQAAYLLKGLTAQCPPVLVMQKSPGHCGGFPLQLARMTGHTVKQVEGDTLLDNGTVYTVDRVFRAWVELDGSRLTLRVAHGQGGTIADELFRSIAEALGKAAICVSLSGEGSSGLGALSRAGGLALMYNKNALLGQPKGIQMGGVAEMAMEDISEEMNKRLRSVI